MSARIVDGTHPSQSPPLDQSDRDGRLDTPLGEDILALSRFHGSEGISQLYEYQVDALSREQNLDFDKLLGKPCSVTIKSMLSVKRHFHGLVTEGYWTGTEGRYFAYRLVLRPWTWMLGRYSQTKIYKKKSVKQIIEEIFKDRGFSDYEFRLNEGELKEIEYCVQYRETDLAFICRLMEEWGVYTFFEHTEKKHTLILCNQRTSHKKIRSSRGLPESHDDLKQSEIDAAFRAVSTDRKPIPVDSFPFLNREHRAGTDLQQLYEWTSTRAYQTGKVSLRDYDYMKPGASLHQEDTTVEKYGGASREAYDYPGRFTENALGEHLARVRLDAQQVADRRVYLAGNAVSLVPGGVFTLSAHDTDNADYLVIQATHHYVSQSYETGGASSGEPYQGKYVAMRHQRQFRAPFVTPRPMVFGPQTAVVTDDDGDKKARRGQGKKWIDVDKEGRILVRFHWDRAQKTPENTSRRVRVAQMWSGKQWGWQVIPRVGQEVVVTFLEGDPDQPLVVGTVYNAENTFPYGLPDNATISGVKTETEDGQPGYNELIFEDKKHSENIRIHAQRFHEITVREKETRTIGVANGSSQVSRETVIEKGHDTLTLKEGNRTTTLKKGDDTTTLEMGNQSTLLKKGSQSTLLKMGDQSTRLELGSQSVEVSNNIDIKANLGITLTCGQSKIEMTPASIKISSVMIQVDGQAMTEVKGGAMVTVKGGLVMIN